MMRLIGVTGRARSGKDTFAQELVRHGYQRIAFADALKHATAFVADEDSNLFFDDMTKEQFCEALGMTRRQALQGLGKAVRDSLGDMTWVNRALRGWVAAGKPAAVITDVRYDNEAAAVRALGGTVVRIVRPDNVGLTGTAAQHESERGVSESLIDVEVVNDGTLADLWAEAQRLRAVLDQGKQ